jgi:hypothetical protein
LAAGTHVIEIAGAVTEQDQQLLWVLFDIAETFVVDNGQTPVNTAANLTALAQSHAQNCTP